MRYQKTPVVHALLAALLFGASAPLIKLFLDEIHPVQMSSFLYLGSAGGLSIFTLLKRFVYGETRKEAGLTRRDIKWLMGATFSGGVLAPVMLIFSLKQISAATASLLLNFESAATALIAAAVFNEAISRRVWMGIALIVVAGVLLSLDAQGEYGFSFSAIGVLSACALWGIDNNLTRQISSKNPVSIVIIKGITAGMFALIVSFIMGHPLPGLFTIFLALLLGLCCYGLSIVFFIQAMRALGSARTGAYFALAPFIGAALSFAIFRELPNMIFVLSLPLLIVGAILLFNERHSHLHTHFEMEHEHSHSHGDVHHQHLHTAGEEHVESRTRVPLMECFSPHSEPGTRLRVREAPTAMLREGATQAPMNDNGPKGLNVHSSHSEREGEAHTALPGEGATQAPVIVHSHLHTHEHMVHEHAHMPDIHHRHAHRHVKIHKEGG